MVADEQARLARLQDAVVAATALATDAQLGVLARLAAGPITPQALARDCAIDERGAHLLLAILAGLGLAEALIDGRFRLVGPESPPAGAPRAVGAHPGDLATSDAGSQPHAPPPPGSLFVTLAERVAARLAAPGLSVLEVTPGSVPWGLALAVRDATCRVTVVDRPAVLPLARRAVAAAGCDAQFTYLRDDRAAAPWGSAGFDLVLLADLGQRCDAAARALVRGLFRALRPGATLALAEVLLNERLDGPPEAIACALRLLLRTRRARTLTFSTVVAWLREAGYEAIARSDLPGVPTLSLVTARRPAP